MIISEIYDPLLSCFWYKVFKLKRILKQIQSKIILALVHNSYIEKQFSASFYTLFIYLKGKKQPLEKIHWNHAKPFNVNTCFIEIAHMQNYSFQSSCPYVGFPRHQRISWSKEQRHHFRHNSRKIEYLIQLKLLLKNKYVLWF